MRNAEANRTIQYSLNEGEWVSITAQKTTAAPSISVSSGDVIRFRGDNAGYSLAFNNYASFSGTTAQFILKGNIMSLISSENFDSILTFSSVRTFSNMFQYCSGLTDASNLQLPATTLSESCYGSMFIGCTNLTKAPELPATTLADSCYENMFYGCTSLTTAPELPATTLANYCYRYMFQNCTSLNYIKAMFTTTPSNSYTRDWVSGVASSGTFVKNSAATWTTTGVNAVPTGWTIQTASA